MKKQSQHKRHASQIKGGKVKSPAKKAASRANGKLGGRPRLTDKPHIYVGHFTGHATKPDADGHKTEAHFTLVVKAVNVKQAQQHFRRLIQRQANAGDMFTGLQEIDMRAINVIDVAQPEVDVVSYFESFQAYDRASVFTMGWGAVRTYSADNNEPWMQLNVPDTPVAEQKQAR